MTGASSGGASTATASGATATSASQRKQEQLKQQETDREKKRKKQQSERDEQNAIEATRERLQKEEAELKKMLRVPPKWSSVNSEKDKFGCKILHQEYVNARSQYQKAKKNTMEKANRGSQLRKSYNAFKSAIDNYLKEEMQNTDKCPVCTQPVNGGHRCPDCKKIVHVICGTPFGEEGTTQPVRCFNCNPKKDESKKNASKEDESKKDASKPNKNKESEDDDDYNDSGSGEKDLSVKLSERTMIRYTRGMETLLVGDERKYRRLQIYRTPPPGIDTGVFFAETASTRITEEAKSAIRQFMDEETEYDASITYKTAFRNACHYWDEVKSVEADYRIVNHKILKSKIGAKIEQHMETTRKQLAALLIYKWAYGWNEAFSTALSLDDMRHNDLIHNCFVLPLLYLFVTRMDPHADLKWDAVLMCQVGNFEKNITRKAREKGVWSNEQLVSEIRNKQITTRECQRAQGVFFPYARMLGLVVEKFEYNIARVHCTWYERRVLDTDISDTVKRVFGY